ncbi:RNA polymerase sigma factor [Streptomyces shenzhenensis]|uniref:RNA polymerase sigma factor n=1 Tax=Streptomyces shenzhenensis TaxID=943815 RepID=UPI0036786366
MKHQANAQINLSGGAVTELVARAAAGDRDAFAVLYNDYRDTVYRYLRSRTGNRDLAEDLTSDTFERALRRIDTFQTRPATGGFVGWLFTIAHNLHVDHLKLARVKREISSPEIILLMKDESAETYGLRKLESAEAARSVAEAMKSLTPAQAQCVRLRYLDGLSVDETAARMGKQRGAVKTLAYRAKCSLEQALAAEGVAV